MRIEQDVKLDFDDVLIRPKRSSLQSRNDVDITRKFQFKHSSITWNGIPIISSNMDSVTDFRVASILYDYDILSAMPKQWNNEISTKDLKLGFNYNPNMIPSFGLDEKETIDNWVNKIANDSTRSYLPFIMVDVANGYTQRFIDFCSTIRDAYKNQIVLIAGNVTTPEMIEELIMSGVDIAKIGIGPGAACETRIKTGIGYPQLSACIECADAAHGVKGHIIADGGCKTPGDIVKAFATGADFVMVGGMFAAHEESPGEEIVQYVQQDRGYYYYETAYYKEGGYTDWSPLEGYSIAKNPPKASDYPSISVFKSIIEEKKFKQFYGMSSKLANEKHNGGLKEYRASEGAELLLPLKGSIRDTVQDILGGLRSACTYVGAASLKELTKRTTFVRILK